MGGFHTLCFSSEFIHFLSYFNPSFLFLTCGFADGHKLFHVLRVHVDPSFSWNFSSEIERIFEKLMQC